ncbi:MAG: SagB/ThcOx family dehydrogenase [Gemmatimonadota bacterium]|nr:MAG: SagB/ThcOx family dehydrogenase [Gemmatimonadota bacterium]
MTREKREVIRLIDPSTEGAMSVEAALHARRSVREYDDAPLTLNEVSQLMWAAQGITHPDGLRTAPSAGALYPLNLHLVVGRVEGIGPGVYRYRSTGHSLVKVAEGDRRCDLAAAALKQEQIERCAVVIVLSAVYERVVGKYGARGVCYAHMEVGLAAENVHLQVVALGLGTVMVGAFEDETVQDILGMVSNEKPLVLMPVGRRRE